MSPMRAVTGNQNVAVYACRCALAALTLLALPVSARAEHAVVVFGSAVKPDGTASPRLLRRLETALDVARLRSASMVVVSGGKSAGQAEGPYMASWLRRRGVAPDRLLVDAHARHTGENAQLVVPLLKRAKVSSVTLVTERFHMRRARMHLRSELRFAGMGDVKVQCHAAPDRLKGLARVGAWCRESAKILRDISFKIRDRLVPPALRHRHLHRHRRPLARQGLASRR
jgi:vancomycin permeability regulator SanA